MSDFNQATAGVDVVIVGRNEIVREGLRRILADQGFSVLATQPDHPVFAAAGEMGSPQLIIVDSPSVAEGIDICALLRAAYPEPRLVMIGDTYDLETVSKAFAVGVDGYLVKAIACEALVGALRLILLGEKVMPSQTLSALAKMSHQPGAMELCALPTDVDLTDRELEILGRLVQGEANKLISRRLLITEATVKVHVKAILRKLHVLNRTQAAIWAVNRGMFAQEGLNIRQAA
jgi:two-component system nitrate/nitrite response regulator NarL